MLQMSEGDLSLIGYRDHKDNLCNDNLKASCTTHRGRFAGTLKCVHMAFRTTS